MPTTPGLWQAEGVTRSRSQTASRQRRRDRHGRGLRGPLLPPTLPGWRTRAERFDDLVLSLVERLERQVGPAMDGVEFAVEAVPPSDPAPWEAGAVPLARYFPADGAAGLAHRIVVYRHPVVARADGAVEIALLLRDVLVEQLAHVLGRDPEDLDPGYGS